MNKLLSMFRAFKYRNFRLFFPALAVSQIGIWIQNTAISWFVYEITKSPFTMGLVMFFNAIPLFLLTPIAGVIVDKFNRHNLLTGVQIAYVIQAFLMTILIFSGCEHLRYIVILGIFLNAIAALDAPLRQSTFVLLIDNKDDLSNVISLNSSCFNAARLIGPAVAGLLIAYTNITFCFFINFLCLIPSIFLISQMKIQDKKSVQIINSSVYDSLKEGMVYIIKRPQIFVLQTYFAAFCFFVLSYPMLLPIYTKEVLHSNADTLGFMMSAIGIGSLVASLLLACKSTTKGIKHILILGSSMVVVTLILIGAIHTYFMALIVMFFMGLGMTAAVTLENVLLHNVVDDDMRGRVMSTNAMCYFGTTSLSGFVAGTIAEFLGIQHTFILLGILLLVANLILYSKFIGYSYQNPSYKDYAQKV